MLYVVATPIGNLEDITLRALRILGECDVIFAEDTRRTRNLLKHHEIGLPSGGVVSCHEHNEAARVESVMRQLADGRVVALVTDAGTPAISDPGYRLVRAAREQGHDVVPVPGACAAVAALSAAGLPTDRFTFAGFPPKKAGARRRFLEDLASAPGTLVLYAPAREVPALLGDLAQVRAGCEVAVFREITKRFEECLRGTPEALIEQWAEAPRKGEVTLLAGKAAGRDWSDTELLELLKEATPAEVAAHTGLSKRRLYQLKLRSAKLDS